MLTKRDELNRPKYEPINYEEWFSVLDLPEEDKEKRVELAKQIDDVFDWLFALVTIMATMNQPIDENYLVLSVQYRLEDILDINVRYVSEHIVKVAGETVETTIEHIGEEYYVSPLRSSEIAANEAQAFYNYEELQEAYDNGYTKKTWLTQRDRKVRRTHAELDGKTIPIEKMFNVGGSEMICPKDTEHGASISEVANCRCVLTYS